MKKKEEEQRERILDLFAKKRDLEVRLRALSEEKDSITSELCALIPEDTVLFGLRHVKIEMKSTRWKDVHALLVNKRLLKPAALAILPSLIDECSSMSTSHRVQEAGKK
jgi:hypothetical protein